jgi:hypothetical protein
VSASERLYKLADRAKQSEESVTRAKEAGQAELKAQVEKARQSSQQRAAALKADGSDAETQVSTRWREVHDDWNRHVTTVRQNVDDRMADHDVKRSERRAQNAEDDAEAAVDFAYAALEEAEYAVLDAALARLEADEVLAAR